MGGSWKEHPDENHNIALCIEENTLNEQGQNMFGLGLCRKEHKWPRTLTYLRQEACRQPSWRGSPSNRTTRLPSDFLPWTVSLIREAEGWGRKMTRLRELVFHCLACVRACVRAWKSVGSQSPTSWTFYEADALCNLGGQVCFSAPPPPRVPLPMATALDFLVFAHMRDWKVLHWLVPNLGQLWLHGRDC